MDDHLWKSIADTAPQLGVIAAFAAVGVSLWVARSTTRARRQQLRQEATIEINVQSVSWSAEAGGFLKGIQGYLDGRVSGKHLNTEALDRMSKASVAMDRALKSAHMTCTDFKIAASLTEAEQLHVKFLGLIGGPHPGSPEERRAKLTRTVSEGLPTVVAFTAAVEAAVLRGFKKYRLRRGVWFHVRRAIAKSKAKWKARSQPSETSES